MTNLTIGDETFKVMVEGDATHPPLMLSNSLGTDLSMWDGQIGALAKHFRVVRYDPRGHGGSEAGRTPASIARLGTDVLAILDALEIDKVHWLGLSMGGAVGLWLLVNAPERIARAVLANTAARLGSAETWNARITSVLSNGMTKNAAATLERWFSPTFAAREPDRIDAVRRMLESASPQNYACACAALRDMDLRASLGAIANEVLVVTGRDDPVIPHADAQILISGIPGARHVVLDARHMSNIEAEADFNTAVIAFLTRPTRKAEDARPKGRTPRKATATKATPVKRGGASRRSNAARTPLKASARKAATKRARVRKATTSPRKTTLPRKAAGAHRRPAAKRSAAAGPVTKAAPKRTNAGKTAKAAPARRATPSAAARGTVKKAKPVKRAARGSASKAPAKKTPAKVSKAPAKKLPAPRRSAVKKPRRPTGRRKS